MLDDLTYLNALIISNAFQLIEDVAQRSRSLFWHLHLFCCSNELTYVLFHPAGVYQKLPKSTFYSEIGAFHFMLEACGGKRKWVGALYPKGNVYCTIHTSRRSVMKRTRAVKALRDSGKDTGGRMKRTVARLTPPVRGSILLTERRLPESACSSS